MPAISGAFERLAAAAGTSVRYEAPLAEYTRFGLGGPADILIDAATERAFIEALGVVRSAGLPFLVIGGGSNLVVADAGYRGVVLRFTGSAIASSGPVVRVESGAVLQDLVDYTVEAGLAGLHTMTGIPGWVGGAIYGNAGAYGNQIDAAVRRVRFFDGSTVRTFTQEECGFAYRESRFKRHKDWIILSAELELTPSDSAPLRARAGEILSIRNAKYPPDMKCAGSIFKNLIYAQLAPAVQAAVPPEKILGGKVPSAWFLEQVDAKGIRNGGIEVATYHANLIYNTGTGTAREVLEIVNDLKARVLRRFGLELEEEVQYVGF